MFCGIKYSPASIYAVRSGSECSAECSLFAVWGNDAVRGQGMDGCTDGALSFFPFIFFHSLSFFVTGAQAPAVKGPQLSPKSVSISLALCINVPWGRGLSSALLKPQPSAGSPDHYNHRLSLQLLCLSIHYAAKSPQLQRLHLCSPLHLPLSLAYSFPVSGLVVHSLIQTRNQSWACQSAIRLVFKQDT